MNAQTPRTEDPLQAPVFMDAEDVGRALTARKAIDSMTAFLLAGFDPETGAPRTRVETASGTFMQMPAANDQYVGTKLLTITPENSKSSSPVIQGLYVLFGGDQQGPLAILDGIALTNWRTSCVSALCVELVVAPGPKRLLVYGTGVQAWEHVKIFNEIFDLLSIEIMGRTPRASEAIVFRAQEAGMDVAVAGADSIEYADIVVCCTASEGPLFDGRKVKPSAVVVAMGSHDRSHRELDDVLMSDASVCVESLGSALREAGDVIQALESGAVAGSSDLITVADMVLGRAAIATDKPVVFKTTGMPWQDLAVAIAAYESRTCAGA
ncbi:ornithine cyclodeaminase family protein [Specibacter sp. NPDC078692]|uniref:ornithine cyclodeaminase family protein n=1 Tax=Specibacter sp. NPDC078692 TaxID=3155818 RepID=UPI0034125D08